MTDKIQVPFKCAEAGIRGNIINACAYTFTAVVFAAGTILTFILQDWLMLLMAGLGALSFGFLAIIAWGIVRMNKQSLAAIQVLALRISSTEQDGAWPPPPEAPKK